MSDSEFWRFSLTFYAKPGVAPACLELQDQCGVDVNVMLYLLFLAQQQRHTNVYAVERIDAVAEPWRKSVVTPLRDLRRLLKTSVGAFEPAFSATLRNDVKRTELAAEQIQQETLERRVPAGSLPTMSGDRVAVARANLLAYGEYLGALPARPIANLLDAFACVALEEKPS